jgi:hypothetical protein
VVLVIRRVLSLALVFLVLFAFGCASGEPADSPSPEATSTVPTGSASPAPDLSYLTGTWAVSTELTSIDNPMMTPAADKPGAQWECSVSGPSMTLTTDQHEYQGTLRTEAGDGWVYTAAAPYVDEDGATWTSSIEVHARPTSGSRDAWTGTMTGTIESDVDGHLYTATWDIAGTR